MASSTQTNYVYINESEIDSELKCVICQRPLETPVRLLVCHHTFCQECIRHWRKNQSTCPVCRRVLKSSHFHPYARVKTPIVSNQLGRLPIRCLLCGRTDIQRGNWESHEETCPKKIVQCPSADVECPWEGLRDALSAHLEICAFEQVRPVIDDLKQSIHLLENRMSFLLQMIDFNAVCVKNILLSNIFHCTHPPEVVSVNRASTNSIPIMKKMIIIWMTIIIFPAMTRTENLCFLFIQEY